jgi:4-oxalocrotonate tautomerase
MCSWKSSGSDVPRSTCRPDMPFIQVNMLAGRTPEQKADLAQRVTQAVAESLNAPPESIRLVIQEYQDWEWFVAGKALPVARPP